MANQGSKTYLVWVFLIWYWWPLAENLVLHSLSFYSFIHIPLPELVEIDVGENSESPGGPAEKNGGSEIKDIPTARSKVFGGAKEMALDAVRGMSGEDGDANDGLTHSGPPQVV